MSWLSIPSVLQLIVGLGLLNVWLLRPKSPTGYRGGEARSLREEFEVYGLPGFAFYVVGGLKILAGVILIAGVWVSLPVQLAAGVVAALMVGALIMHVKVGDPAKKSVPAVVMLVLSLAIVFLS
ncbi:MAG: DoxX family protein [Gemmatimonadales bacterium]|nr:MAG: DoxX family protein [Gemmatimonadales bacterium]